MSDAAHRRLHAVWNKLSILHELFLEGKKEADPSFIYWARLRKIDLSGIVA